MKIYHSDEDGVIGDLLYQTVEFTRKELTEGGVGVISQGAVQRYLVGKRPDLKIKKLGSFKFDGQANTVSVRIGTTKGKRVVLPDDNQKPVALLNPGYNELKAKYDMLIRDFDALKNTYDALVVAVAKDVQKFSDLLVENERLKKQFESEHNLCLCPECKEDIADLADAKEAIKDDDSVPLSEVEDKVDGTVG